MAISHQIPWHQTLRFKLIGWLLLITTVILSAAGFVAYEYTKRQATSDLSILADVTADRLSNHIEVPMWDVDNNQVSKLLEAEMTELRLVGVVVRDEDKRSLFAAKERGPGGNVIDSDGNINGDLVNAVRDIKRGDKIIGSISVYMSREESKRDLNKFAQGIIAVVIGLNLILLILMAILIGRMLLRPLSQLTETAEKIAQGDLSQRMTLNSNDEIGYLATTFNKMQSSLRVAIRRLTKA